MLELPFGNAIRVYIGIPDDRGAPTWANKILSSGNVERRKKKGREKERKRWDRQTRREEAVYTASHEYSNRAARHQVSGGFVSMRCRPVGFPGPGCSIVAPERPFINHRERREIPVSRGRATGTGLVNSTSYRDKVPGRDTLWPTYPRESHDFRLSRFRHRDRLHGSARWDIIRFSYIFAL